MDFHPDSNTDASDDWLTMAIRDAIEIEDSSVTYNVSQDVEKFPVAVSVLPADTEVIDDISPSSLLQTGYVPVRADSAHFGALRGTAGWNGYEQTSPSLQTLNRDLNGLQSDDEGSELEFYEALANNGISYRKVKKHTPMHAEQQQSKSYCFHFSIEHR